MLSEAYVGVIHGDRARRDWQFDKLPWCGAHLRRDFQAWIDNPCQTTKRLGRDLMRPTLELFALGKRVRDGTLSRSQFLIDVQAIRREIDALLLLLGFFNALTHSVCKELGNTATISGRSSKSTASSRPTTPSGHCVTP